MLGRSVADIFSTVNILQPLNPDVILGAMIVLEDTVLSNKSLKMSFSWLGALTPDHYL